MESIDKLANETKYVWRTYLYTNRRFWTAQTNNPALLAEAKYTPFVDIARAVTAPEQASSVKVEVFCQLLRDIVAISRCGPSVRVMRIHVGILAMCAGSNEEILSRSVPDSCAVMLPFR